MSYRGGIEISNSMLNNYNKLESAKENEKILSKNTSAEKMDGSRKLFPMEVRVVSVGPQCLSKGFSGVAILSLEDS